MQMRQVVTPHDQIMGDVDANMRNRPRPPPLMANQGQPPMPPGSPQSQRRSQQQAQQQFSSNYDAQTAMRVRRWIESKSVTDVKDCRPFLNQEIRQGFALKKTTNRNDRSAPRF